MRAFSAAPEAGAEGGAYQQHDSSGDSAASDNQRQVENPALPPCQLAGIATDVNDSSDTNQQDDDDVGRVREGLCGTNLQPGQPLAGQAAVVEEEE